MANVMLVEHRKEACHKIELLLDLVKLPYQNDVVVREQACDVSLRGLPSLVEIGDDRQQLLVTDSRGKQALVGPIATKRTHDEQDRDYNNGDGDKPVTIHVESS